MSLAEKRSREWLKKKLRQGFRGFPVASVAFYGPDDRHATKIAIGYRASADSDADIVQRFFSKDAQSDLRNDKDTERALLDLLKNLNVKSVVLVDGILGCPHEEGIDYPEGEACPQCPFWNGRDRFTGELEAE